MRQGKRPVSRHAQCRAFRRHAAPDAKRKGDAASRRSPGQSVYRRRDTSAAVHGQPAHAHHHGTGQKDRCYRLRRREFIMKAKHTAGCTAMQPAVFFYSSVLSICFALSFGMTFPIAPTMTPLSSIRYKSAGGCFFYGRNTGLHLSRDQKHFSLRSFLHCSMRPHR